MSAARPERRRRGPRPIVLLVVALPTLLSAALLLRVPVHDLTDEGTSYPTVLDSWMVMVVVVAGLLVAQRLRWYYGRRLVHGPAGATPVVAPPRTLEPAAERAVLLLLAAAGLPFALTWAMAAGAPGVHPGLWRLVSTCALLPPALLALFGLLPRRVAAALTPAKAWLAVGSALLALSATELALRAAREPLQLPHPTVSAPDRSYWHWLPGSVLDDAGLAAPMNSWGFRGGEPPGPGPDRATVLVLGDSIPFGGRFPLEQTFPGVAEARLDARREAGAALPDTAVLNAGMPGFATLQIRDLYRGHLSRLPHDLALFCFQLDDVNREARYRKGGILYTPAWPEWVQDLYYRSRLAHEVLQAVHVRAETFQQERRRNYAQAFPEALAALEACRVEAEARGARLAVFELPRFDWPGTLSRADDYAHSWSSRSLQRWCAEAGVPYATALHALVGRDMASMRISRQDIHLTAEGHAVVGAALADFLQALLTETPAQ